MNVLVAFESHRGHTQKEAEAIAAAVRGLGHEAVVKSVKEVRAEDVRKADVLFIGTWVQGFILFGVRPAGAKQWVPVLPSLKGKPVGVFCTFAFNPHDALHKLSAMLESLGARVVGERAFQQNRSSEGVESFVKSVLDAAVQPSGKSRKGAASVK